MTHNTLHIITLTILAILSPGCVTITSYGATSSHHTWDQYRKGCILANGDLALLRRQLDWDDKRIRGQFFVISKDQITGWIDQTSEKDDANRRTLIRLPRDIPLQIVTTDAADAAPPATTLLDTELLKGKSIEKWKIDQNIPYDFGPIHVDIDASQLPYLVYSGYGHSAGESVEFGLLLIPSLCADVVLSPIEILCPWVFSLTFMANPAWTSPPSEKVVDDHHAEISIPFDPASNPVNDVAQAIQSKDFHFVVLYTSISSESPGGWGNRLFEHCRVRKLYFQQGYGPEYQQAKEYANVFNVLMLKYLRGEQPYDKSVQSLQRSLQQHDFRFIKYRDDWKILGTDGRDALLARVGTKPLTWPSAYDINDQQVVDFVTVYNLLLAKHLESIPAEGNGDNP